MVPKDNIKPNRIKRRDADEVFLATATEPLRKKGAKTPLHLHQAERDRIHNEAQGIVDKSNAKKKRS